MTATKLLADNGVTSGITGYQLTGGNDGTLQLQTTTAGGTATTALTIDNSQNVGIGTASPTFDAGSGVSVVRSGGSATIQASRSDASTAGSVALIGGSLTNSIYSVGAKPLNFFTDSTERMRIDSSGNLLVGNTSGTSKVTVTGVVESTTGGFKFPDGTTQTTSATSAGTTFGSIGSYVIAGASGLAASTAYAAGTTVAGSTLYYDNTGGSTYGAPLASQGYNAITIGTVVSYGLSGTWRLMCRIAQGSNTGYYAPALWVRIS